MGFFGISFAALSFLCAALAQEQEQPVSISEEVLVDFRQSHGVKPDYELPIQSISDGNTVTLPDGTVVSLSDMTPRSYFTSSAKCFENDVQTPCPPPTVSVKTDENGLKIIAANDENGEISNILIIDEASGTEVSFEAVAPGYVTYIPEDAYDDDYFNQFILADPVGYTDDMEERIRRRVQIMEDPEEHKTRQLQRGDCTQLRVIETAIAVESSYCQEIGGSNDVDRTVNNIMARVAAEYEQPNLCFTAAISHFEKYCDPDTDPYKAGVDQNDSSILVNYFKSYWNNNRRDVNRDIAELFSGTALQCNNNGCVIGQASNIGTSCTNSASDSYGVNYILFTQNQFGRSNLVAHEMGHVLGAVHDSSSTSNIMYPQVQLAEQDFSRQSVDSFDVPRNERCFALCLASGEECDESADNCCPGFTCGTTRANFFPGPSNPTCQ